MKSTRLLWSSSSPFRETTREFLCFAIACLRLFAELGAGEETEAQRRPSKRVQVGLSFV
jgi:hypothetical protein